MGSDTAWCASVVISREQFLNAGLMGKGLQAWDRRGRSPGAVRRDRCQDDNWVRSVLMVKVFGVKDLPEALPLAGQGPFCIAHFRLNLGAGSPA